VVISTVQHQTKVFYFLLLDFARLPDHHIFTGYGGHGLLYVYVLATFLSRFIFLGCSYLEFTKYEYNVSKYFAI
jgi:hypothetical protein